MKEKKTIEANAIHLTDADGRVRIILDADLPDGLASITLLSKTGNHSVHISTQPDDRAEISVRGKNGLANATILITPESDHCSIAVTEPDGKPAITIGRFPYDESPHGVADVIVYKNGHPTHRLKDK
jgi:hypothetical protein